MPIFKFIYMKNHIYHLKDLKKLYKGHLNGTYRFPIRNSETWSSKLWKMHFLCIFCILSKYFRYFRWEIDMFRLNVLYITWHYFKWYIYGFSYKWIWKSAFFEVMVKTLWKNHKRAKKQIYTGYNLVTSCFHKI